MSGSSWAVLGGPPISAMQSGYAGGGNMLDPLNVIIDISHHNGNVNLAKAKEDGILGVIQKATQGQTFKDPNYESQSAKGEGRWPTTTKRSRGAGPTPPIRRPR